MTSTAGTRLVSSQLAASVVDTVLLTDPGFGVSISNDSGSAPIWFTVSHPGGPCPVPSTSASVSSNYVAGTAGQTVNFRHPGQFGSVVQLVSTGTPEYTVTVLGNQANM